MTEEIGMTDAALGIEINRLRAKVEKARMILAYMDVDNLTRNYDRVIDLWGDLYNLREVLKD
jgi:hypothetical protein